MKTALTPERLLTIKGAPEILLDRVGFYLGNAGVSVPLDDIARKAIETTKDEWASQGKRVLLLARKAISRSTFSSEMSEMAWESEIQNQAKSGLTLVGLVGIVDPPRPEIPSVIDILRTAGIRIFMVDNFPLPLNNN